MSFDGASTDEQKLEFARIVDDHPEMVESLVEQALIHCLPQRDSERASTNVAAHKAIVACEIHDMGYKPLC